MHNHRQGINFLAIDQDVQLDDVGRSEFLEIVVERGISARDGFQLVEEIHDHFSHRHLIDQLNLTPVVGHVHLIATLLVAQGNDVAEVLLWNKDGNRDDRFANLFDF